MSLPYNYMQRTLDMFTAMSPTPTIDDVINNKDIVIEIGENVQLSPYFVSHKEEFDSFCQSIETHIEDRKERLTAAWHHFIERFSNAPSAEEVPYIIFMCMPAVSKYLLDYSANPDPLKPKADETTGA